MHSHFGEIISQAVEDIPRAVGGALAAGDGETVDYYTTWNKDKWHLMTAHIGILVSHMRRSLHTFHFGDVQFIQLGYQELELAIQLVDHDYYLLMAMRPPVPILLVRRRMHAITDALREEIG